MVVKSKVSKQLKVEVKVSTDGPTSNVANLPKSALRETVFSYGDEKVIAHFTKVWPSRDWGCDFTLSVNVLNQTPVQQTPLNSDLIINTDRTSLNAEGEFNCRSCGEKAFLGMDYCERCGESLHPASKYDDYYEGGKTNF